MLKQRKSPTTQTKKTVQKKTIKKINKRRTQTTSHRHLSTQNDANKTRVIYENKLNKQQKFRQAAITLLAPFATLQVIGGTILSPEISVAVPALTAVVATGLGYYNWIHMRDRATEVSITGPNDPVVIKTPTFWGGEKKHVVNREDFMGLLKFEYSKNYVDPKFPFICRVKGQTRPFVLSRHGLFDSSGVLSPILGVDVLTYERCPPSEPYDHQAALDWQSAKAKHDNKSINNPQNKTEKKVDPSNEV